jgi:diadenylate cyclase
MENLKAAAATLKLWCTRDWEAKLVALVLAFLLWYVIDDQISRGQRIFDTMSTRTLRA